MDQITIEQVIDKLNEFLILDKAAIKQLIEYRVPCNEAMKNHKTIQVLVDEDGRNARVGLLGILNGFFGVEEDGWGKICASFDEDGDLLGFQKKDK
jgi:hypothetical protein